MVCFTGIAIPSMGGFGKDGEFRTASCGDALEGFELFGIERHEHLILFAAASYIFVDRSVKKKSDPVEAAQFLQIGEESVGYVHSDPQVAGGMRDETSSKSRMAKAVFRRDATAP